MAANLTPQQQADLASLAYGLAHNPKTRAGLAKLVKEISPERAAKSFRDVEQDERFEAFKAEIEDKVDLKGAKAAKSKQDEQKAKLAERYDEKQLEGIEAVATKFGLSDLDAAAVLYAHESGESDPTMRPRHPDPVKDATWEFPTVAGKDGKPMPFKEFASDLKGASLNAAYRTIDELNSFKNKTLSPAFRR